MREAKGRWTDIDLVSEGSRRGLAFRVNAMANGTALHENDRVMSVLSRDGCGQTGDKLRLGPASDHFKTGGREVVTFIHDNVAVISHAVVHDALPNQALYERYVQPAR